MSSGRGFLVVALLGAAVCFSGTFNHSLWRPDEPRDAEIGRAMVASGDFVVPKIGREAFLEKPPLFWWLMSGFYSAFGVSAGAARATAALASYLLLLLVYDLGRRVARPEVGVLSSLVLATTTGFFLSSPVCRVDSWLALFVGLGHWGFVLWLEGSELPERPRTRALGIFAVYAAAGLAFLTKGPVGPALIAGPIAAVLPWLGRLALRRSWAHLSGLALLAACVALWPVLLYRRGGVELLEGFLVQNVAYRIFDTDERLYFGGHKQPWWFHFARVGETLSPWLASIPALAHWLLRRSPPPAWRRRALLFLASVWPVGMALLSLPATKRNVYVLPLLAPLACVVGAWIDATGGASQSLAIDRATRRCMALGLAAAALIGSVVAAAIGLGAGSLPHLDLHLQGGGLRPLHAFGVALALLMIAALACRAELGERRERQSAGLLLPAALAAVAIVVNLTYYPLLDPRRDLQAMPKGLERLGAMDRPLIAFQVEKTIEEIVPFHTGRILDTVGSADELRCRLAAAPGAWVLASDRTIGAIPPDLRARLVTLQRWDYSHRTRTSYTLLAPVSE